MVKSSWRTKVKTLLSVVWLMLTFSIVAWWLVYSLQRTDISEATHRMFAWEGAILLLAILVGGGTMTILTYKDEQRQHRLRFFFATFSHDIKTSIARLRLQADVLEEDSEQSKNPVFKRLIHDITRLELQLENSLLLSNLESGFYVEEFTLSSVIKTLRNDFSDLKIELNHDAKIKADKRAFFSVIRNIFQNSVLHGKADAVQIQATAQGSDVLISILDNGSGFQGNSKKLGKEILRSQDSRGNGIGLFLSKRLVSKMKGRLQFSTSPSGFKADLQIPGGMA